MAATGAGALRVAVPRREVPPVTVEVESVKLTKVGRGGVTMRLVGCELAP